MANEICIGLDLGSDTLKIAYAFGSDKCGKFLDDKHSLNVAVPAVAYYDRAAGKWIYGDGVDSGERSFIARTRRRSSKRTGNTTPTAIVSPSSVFPRAAKCSTISGRWCAAT